MTVDIDRSLTAGRSFWQQGATVKGAITLMAGSLVLAACGSTASGDSLAPTATPTAVCTGTVAPPNYTNGVTTVAGQAKTLSGAGSTFVAPMMSVWAAAYATDGGVQVAYQSVGSGAGVAQIQANTVAFGDF